MSAAPLREAPVWLEGLELPAPAPRPLPARVDVAVVGAGYTGLAAARQLARHGAQVAVLEAQAVGWGASSRNGGMVLTGLKLDAGALVHAYGVELAQRLFAVSLAAIATVERLVAEERIDCAFGRCGHLVAAAKPGHLAALAQEAALLEQTFGHACQLLGRAELPAEVGSAAYHGGLVDRHSAGIDPARYLLGLAGAAVRAGAQVYANTPVRQIWRGRGGFRVVTEGGTLYAADVVVATGGYTGAATPRLRRRFVPLGSYCIATERLTDPLARSLIPRDRMVFNTRHLLHYFRLTPDRRLLFGGRAAFVPATPVSVRESARLLQQEMLQIFPQLRGIGVTHAWGGTLDVPFDLMPHSGQIDGLHYAIGYAGHGVALATELGQRLADKIAGRPGDNPFAELPLPGAPLGLYSGRPWFLPLVGAWYRLRDWLE